VNKLSKSDISFFYPGFSETNIMVVSVNTVSVIQIGPLTQKGEVGIR